MLLVGNFKVSYLFQVLMNNCNENISTLGKLARIRLKKILLNCNLKNLIQVYEKTKN